MGALDFVRIVSIVALAALGLGLVELAVPGATVGAGAAVAGGRAEDAQASFEVQPRVFYEDFKNIVLYVQDVRPGGRGGAVAACVCGGPDEAGEPSDDDGGLRRWWWQGRTARAHGRRYGCIC